MCGAPATTTIPSATSAGAFAGGTFGCPVAGAKELAINTISLALVSLYALYWEKKFKSRHFLHLFLTWKIVLRTKNKQMENI